VSVERSAGACEPGKHEPGFVVVGSTSGQANVAVAVCIDPSVPVASAMMVALPFPKALATPPFSLPGAALLLVVTGNTFGPDEIQLTELVRSLMVGGVENVPIAKNCPVSPKFPTVIELGIMVTESRSWGAAVSEAARLAVLDTTVPSAFVNSAVIVVAPAAKSVANPDALTEATVGALELHLIWVEFVTSVCRPVDPEVPSAINCPVSPNVDSDCELGMIVTAVNFSAVPPATVNVAVPVTTVPPAELV